MFRIAMVLLLGMSMPTALAREASLNVDDTLLPRGVMRAIKQATIAVEFSAPVRRVAYREGQAFKAGDTLVAFDCRKQQAEYDAVSAKRREMELTLEHNRYLSDRGAIGQHDIEISKTRVAKATAEAEALALRLERCTIKAPFDGSVIELSIFEHELPAPGKPFIKIVGARDREVELIVPSKWLVWLKSKATFEFNVEETGKTYKGAVTRIATAVDPISQTVKIFGTLETAADVLPGMSGIANFPQVVHSREQ